MGMPINSENRRQIAADGTIFEVLDDGTIKRIGKLSDDGNFEPFREQKNWNCPRCGTENESEDNFCGKCGTKKPERLVWTCPNCGKEGIESRFCPDCGTKKPESLVWTCPNCGKQEIESKFCPDCGKPADAEEISEQKRTENYIDKGDYIELVHPVGNIRMIEKICSPNDMTWEQAIQYAKKLRKGSFDDWRVPTKEELEAIYKIKNVCGIYKNEGWFWSSSISLYDTDFAWIVYFVDGHVSLNYKSNNFYARCVR